MKANPFIHCCLLCLLLLPAWCTAQKLILPNAYAHNDYWHKRPLHDALENGFTYVEADVYLRGNRIIVAHMLPFLKKKRTLEELYLKPLMDYAAGNGQRGSRYPVTLMIDIKGNANKTFAGLLALLQQYKPILSSYENGQVHLRQVTVVITGHKPAILLHNGEDRLVFLDEDLRKAGCSPSGNAYQVASCRYSSIIKWKGRGQMPDHEKQLLTDYVAKAHEQGCKVRLWASPEKAAVWNELLRCNVDLINTNKLSRLRDFLIGENLAVDAGEQPLTANAVVDELPATAAK